jgi:F0F1-type ATP synthase membrane subunit b/b'
VSESREKRGWGRRLPALLVALSIGIAGVAWAGCGGGGDSTSEARNRIENGLEEAKEGLERGKKEARKSIERAKQEAQRGIEEGKKEAQRGIEEAEKHTGE